MKFDHIGIIIPSLAVGREHLASMLNIEQWTEEFTDPLNEAHIQFGRDGSGICYELIAPLDDTSTIAKMLANGRNILNHIAYLVPDLTSAVEHLRHSGSMPTGKARPAVAYGGKHIQFFLTPLGFVIELIEAPDHMHAYTWK